MDPRLTIGLVTLAVFVLTLLFHIFVLRPFCMGWGATKEELSQSWPGDEFIDHPKTYATHALTIQAKPSEIWPWLVQVGQNRAGFYSYDWIENLFGFEMTNAHEIVEEWQSLKVDDGLLLHPHATPLRVSHCIPENCIVAVGGQALQGEKTVVDPSVMRLNRYEGYTWAFFLRPKADGSTRFIARIRATWKPGLIDNLRNWCFMEPAHLIMQLKMNRGLKQRAESFASQTKKQNSEQRLREVKTLS